MDNSHQRHVVVRNTFLEFSDDAPALESQEPLEPRRVRAQSDLTDMKLPLKVELSSNANFYQVTRHRLSSAFDGSSDTSPTSAVGSAGFGLTGGLTSAGTPSSPGLLPTVMEEPNDLPGLSLTELLERAGTSGNLLGRTTASEDPALNRTMPSPPHLGEISLFGGLNSNGGHNGSATSSVGPQGPPSPFGGALPPWWGSYAGMPDAVAGYAPFPGAGLAGQASADVIAQAQWAAALASLVSPGVSGMGGLTGTVAGPRTQNTAAAATVAAAAAASLAAAAAVAPGPQPQRGRRSPTSPQTMPQASVGNAGPDNVGRSRLQLSEHLRDNGGRAAAAPRAPKVQGAATGPGAAPAMPLEFPPSGDAKTAAEPTTVMLRNLPNGYARSQLLELLDNHGFVSKYDFVYLPMDFRNGVNLGYAFVNLLEHEDALALTSALQGFCGWTSDSSKVCEVSWAHPHQGLREHVERYRNSPVMHASMPDDYKPMVFRSGARVPFPPPTKTIKAPKLRLTAREGRAQGQDAGTDASQLGRCEVPSMADFVAVCA